MRWMWMLDEIEWDKMSLIALEESLEFLRGVIKDIEKVRANIRIAEQFRLLDLLKEQDEEERIYGVWNE